jgi:serine O-acetyltransferase
MKEFFDNIRKKDPAAKSTFEIILCYPGVHSLFFHRIAHFLLEAKIPVLPRFISHISRVLTGIEIHPGAVIGKNFFIDHGFGVVIGETAIIGDNVTLYQNITLGGKSLNRNEKRHPTIADNVTIGAGAKIIGNITIGKSARVGSGSIVTKDVAANKTVAGNPAREISKSDEPEYYI